VATSSFENTGALRNEWTIALALLYGRVAVGGLFFWWGTKKILDPAFGAAVSSNFYGGAFSMEALIMAFGFFQVVIGILMILGLFRRIVHVAGAVMLGFTAISVWYSIVDPFNLWLKNKRPVGNSQLFYPTSINLAAQLILLATIGQDRLALDRILFRGKFR